MMIIRVLSFPHTNYSRLFYIIYQDSWLRIYLQQVTTMQGKQWQKMKFPRTANDKNSQQQTTASEYQTLSVQLRSILSSLLQQKQTMQLRIANQRINYKQQLAQKQQYIRNLTQQSQGFKDQIANLRTQADQKRTLTQFLNKKNSKLQLERDSLANIINYLQQKNKQLSEQIYELKKAKNLTQRHSNPNKNQIPFLPLYAKYLQRQSLLEYTDFVEKDFLPMDILKTEHQQDGNIITPDEESERITIQKGNYYEQRNAPHNLERIRSMGQILSPSREKNFKLSKGNNTKKRDSISKRQITNLIKQSKKGDKLRRDSKKTTTSISKEVSLKRLESS